MEYKISEGFSENRLDPRITPRIRLEAVEEIENYLYRKGIEYKAFLKVYLEDIEDKKGIIYIPVKYYNQDEHGEIGSAMFKCRDGDIKFSITLTPIEPLVSRVLCPQDYNFTMEVQLKLTNPGRYFQVAFPKIDANRYCDIARKVLEIWIKNSKTEKGKQEEKKMEKMLSKITDFEIEEK